MPFLARIANFYRTLFSKRRLERDLNDELHGYVEELTERKIRDGIDPVAARRLKRCTMSRSSQQGDSICQARRVKLSIVVDS